MRSFVLCIVLGLAAPGAVGHQSTSPNHPIRPNIVFILIDDLRADALGCTGHPFAKTPNIDRIAREGGRFTAAFVTTPLCSPSRASILTGKYARTHQITGNGENSALSHRLITFPGLLKRAGYETAYIGKFHMGQDGSPRPGLDRWVSFNGLGTYQNPALNIDGKEETVQGYLTDILADHAVQFIRGTHEKPFVLYFTGKAVNPPYDEPAERHKDLFAGQTVPRSPSQFDTLEGKPMLRRKVGTRPALRPGPEMIPDELVLQYYRLLASVDEAVGRILTALRETGQLDRTLVLFTADHGVHHGEHRVAGGRHFPSDPTLGRRTPYEESLRVPFLVRYPGLVPAGSVWDQLVINVDIAPTLLDVAGVPAPREMQGRSIVPLLRGKTEGWRPAFFAEYFPDELDARILRWNAIRTERWKYIQFPENEGFDELYDLQSDPHELKNLIEEPTAQSTLRGLTAELEKMDRDIPKGSQTP